MNWRVKTGVAQARASVHRLAGCPDAMFCVREARRKGGLVAEVVAPEGQRPAVLFVEATGGEMSYRGTKGPGNARKYGAAVAAFHRAAVPVGRPRHRPGMNLHALLARPLEVVGRNLEGEDARFLADIGGDLREDILGMTGLSVGFCHGDLNSSNVHFDDATATVFDLDCCHWGWVANDVAAFMRGVTLGKAPDPEVNGLIRAFLEGYQAARDLPSPDAAALSSFPLVQRIWLAALHLGGAHRWGAHHFGPGYARRLVGWLGAWRGWRPE